MQEVTICVFVCACLLRVNVYVNILEKNVNKKKCKIKKREGRGERNVCERVKSTSTKVHNGSCAVYQGCV